MPNIKPIVTYSLAAVVVVWVMLGAITLPNATRWFRGSGNFIIEDIVSFNVSKPFTIGNAIPVPYAQKEFRNNVFLVENTPGIAKGGLQSTNCYLADKIMNAERDGAVAAIVFDNGTSVNQEAMGVMPKTIRIPTYFVNQDTGISMINDLENAAKAQQQEGATRLMLRVDLQPPSKPPLDHWQFALIIIGAMLVTSMISISVLQCHMWRIARERRQEENETLTLAEQQQLTADENYWRNIIGQPPRLTPQPQSTKQRLDQTLVDLLPTRIYKDKENLDGKEKANWSKNGSVVSLETAYEPSSCVICLDPFENGDVLRRLPCNHEYHRDCVDVWLTKKCGSCPLCLHHIQIPTVPDEIHAQERAEPGYYDTGDLVTTWQSLTRDEDVLLRQHPFAFNPTPPSGAASFTNPYPPA
ncbi:hypothetical protein [Parasitella parasitica]|uniref:RING-type domain-containing protein n=1 Tax=Parasitella parasitica TaxID=35722 RepID=A0A0B7NMR4_9FUNG|nr:hypothetical protein [Parasitella parasitica]